MWDFSKPWYSLIILPYKLTEVVGLNIIVCLYKYNNINKG